METDSPTANTMERTRDPLQVQWKWPESPSKYNENGQIPTANTLGRARVPLQIQWNWPGSHCKYNRNSQSHCKYNENSQSHFKYNGNDQISLQVQRKQQPTANAVERARVPQQIQWKGPESHCTHNAQSMLQVCVLLGLPLLVDIEQVVSSSLADVEGRMDCRQPRLPHQGQST